MLLIRIALLLIALVISRICLRRQLAPSNELRKLRLPLSLQKLVVELLLLLLLKLPLLVRSGAALRSARYATARQKAGEILQRIGQPGR